MGAWCSGRHMGVGGSGRWQQRWKGRRQGQLGQRSMLQGWKGAARATAPSPTAAPRHASLNTSRSTAQILQNSHHRLFIEGEALHAAQRVGGRRNVCKHDPRLQHRGHGGCEHSRVGAWLAGTSCDARRCQPVPRLQHGSHSQADACSTQTSWRKQQAKQQPQPPHRRCSSNQHAAAAPGRAAGRCAWSRHR